MITAQLEEVRKELNCLQTVYDLLQAEKNDVCGKLRMALSELLSAKSSLDRMNKGSITLDEILMQQRSEKQKTGLGFNPESSNSKQSGKSVFVKGPALYSGILFFFLKSKLFLQFLNKIQKRKSIIKMIIETSQGAYPLCYITALFKERHKLNQIITTAQ